MLGYHTLWRRKKLRCMIAGFLVLSMMITLFLVVGSSNTLVDIEDNHHRNYRSYYKGSVNLLQNKRLLVALPHDGFNKIQDYMKDGYDHNKDSEYKKKSSHARFKNTGQKGHPALNDPPSDGVDDGDYGGKVNDDYNNDGYYGDDKVDGGDHNNKAVGQFVHKKQDGFVIEDNAANYNKDYNDEDDDSDDYQDDDDGDGDDNYENDYANRPFRPGDFDYSILNKTIKDKVDVKFNNIPPNKKSQVSNELKDHNKTQVYNSVQYKSMHLLENRQYQTDGNIQDSSNNIKNNNKPSKISQMFYLASKESDQKLMLPNESNQPEAKVVKDHKLPCLAGPGCHVEHERPQGPSSSWENNVPQQIGKGNHKALSSSVNIRFESSLVHHDGNDESKLPAASAPRSKYDPIIHMSQKGQPGTNFHQSNNNKKPNFILNKDTSEINNARIISSNSGTSSNDINYQTTNFIVGQNGEQRIETQIPIQDGFDNQWMVQDQPATQIQMPELPWQPGEVRSPGGVPLIVDNIYWSKEVEDLVPRGMTDEDFQHFLHKIHTTPVKEMHPPLWNRCGRPRNQYIVLQDHTPLCARFREEHVKLLHGEVLSFYLSRILGLDNVPIVVLSEANSADTQWQGMNLTAAGWNESSIVALIQWIDGLESERSRVKMPSGILEAYERGGVFDHRHKDVHLLNANNLTNLIQWSDLILFDYLTGHYDRVASMQDGADREQKPSIMHESIRNLRRVWQNNKMWLIDNESGLLDGFELLYNGGEMGRKFVQFHIQMLQTNCIFRKETVQKIFQLTSLSSPHEALVKYASAQDPLYQHLPYTKEMQLFKKYFPVRLKEVVNWITKCQNR